MLRMYSAVALPSSMRAAPAKNRIWSTIGGISSLAVIPMGLPVFSTSIAIRSSALDSMASAMRNSARDRSDGVEFRHSSNAAPAAFMARSTSSAPDSGAVAYG